MRKSVVHRGPTITCFKRGRGIRTQRETTTTITVSKHVEKENQRKKGNKRTQA
jgi:hypothetical protein